MGRAALVHGTADSGEIKLPEQNIYWMCCFCLRPPAPHLIRGAPLYFRVLGINTGWKFLFPCFIVAAKEFRRNFEIVLECFCVQQKGEFLSPH